MFSLKLNRANILYLILFTGVFSDLIRVHGSSITLYRLLMFLGLAIAVSIRYKKVLQIANTIIDEIRQTQEKNLTISFKNDDK